MENSDYDIGALFVKSVSTFVGKRALSPWLWSERIFRFSYRKELEELEKMWAKFTGQRMRLNENIDVRTVPQAFVNLQKEYPTFSDADLHFEMKIFLGAGSETSSVAVCSCLMLLGRHPHVQEKLYSEIVSLLGPEERDVTTEEVNTLQYLDQVIKESLRIATIIVILQRTVSEEIVLSDCTIPKGGSVMVSIPGLHFDPQVYPNPHLFDPDRFTPENVAKRHPYSFLPFGGGPRNCIGKQFAMKSMKIMLIHILRAYKVSTNINLRDLSYTTLVTLISAEGYFIRLEPRI